MPRVDDSSTRVRVGRVPFESTDLQSAVDRVIAASCNAEAIPVRLSNAYCVALASKDEQYASLLNSRGLNFPDGTPVVWAMRVGRGSESKPGRVRGPAFFRNMVDRGREHKIRHFLLGTDEPTLVKLSANLEAKFPGTVISGTYPPPFGPVDEEFFDTCVERVRRTDAQIIWVALGTPKQDFVAAELSKRLGLPCVGVGAAFDFESGMTKEAPVWVQRIGFEWAYRFASEPRRLWRRYVFGNVRFLFSVLFERDLKQETAG